MPIQSQAYLDEELIARVRSGGVGGLTTASDMRTLLQDIIDTLFGGDEANATSISSLASEVVLLAGGQTVTGLLTFDVLPESSEEPSISTQFVPYGFLETYVAAQIAEIGAGGNFDSSAPIKRQIPGMLGVVLNKTTVVDTLTAFLYPVEYPLVAVTIPIPYHEYGDTGPVVVSWTITKTDQNIDSIIVAGNVITPTGNTQNGNTNVPTGANGNTVISVTGSSQGSSQTQQVTSYVSKKIRVGTCVHDGLTNLITDADINALTGYFAPNGTVGFDNDVTVTAAEYLVIEIPNSMGIPLIMLDGVRWNAYNQIRNNAAFVNSFGYSDDVNVFVSTVPLPGTYNIQFN